MDEQLLKDFVATAEKYNYNWDTIFSKFPELQGYDQQLLKDYVATAQKDGYNYSVSNAKFPEFRLIKSSQQTTAPRPNPNAGQQPQQQPQPQFQQQAQPQPQPEVQQDIMQGVQPQQQPQPQEQQYNKLNYKAVPEQTETTGTRQLFSGISKYIPGFEESMQELETKKKVASELELSAQKELTDYTSKQLESDILSDSLQYESDVQKMPFIKDGFLKDLYQQVQAEQRIPEFVKDQLSQINEELIGGIENRFGFSTIGIEERAVPKLNYMFGDLGFTFEEYGAGDNALVKAPNGESYVVELDNLTKSGDTEEVKKLKDFITKHSANIPNIASYAKYYAGSKRKFVDDEQVDTAIKFNNANANLLAADIQSYVDERTILEKEIAVLNSTPVDERNTPEFKLKSEELNNRYLELAKKQQKVLQNTYELEAKQRMLQRSIGKYVANQQSQGTWLGGTLNWLSEGMGSMLAGSASPIIDMYYSKYATGMNEEELASLVPDGVATGDPITDLNNGGEAVYFAQAINKGGQAYIPLPKKGESYKDWYNSLTEDQRIALVDKSNDDLKKSVKKEVLPIFRNLHESFYGNKNTSEKWQALKEEGFWGGAYAGLMKSLPAMVGVGGPVGWAQRTAQLYAQTTDAVYKEMENNPEFDNISEEEKLKVVVPIGMATAVLEAYGLRNVLANKGITSRIVMSVIGKSGATVTSKTFNELIRNEVNSMAAKGLLTATGAALAEGETGALQQVAEYGVKDIYNASKGKKMFDNPEFLSADYVHDVVKSGAQEAVGGFIMGVPNSVSNAYSKKGYHSLSDVEFETFEAIANDGRIQEAFIANLRNQVATGSLSPIEAKERLNDYRNSVGLYRSVPVNLSIYDKKEAMNLIQEKRALEQQMKDKDSALVSRQRSRVEEINNKLKNLSNKTTDAAATTAPDQNVDLENALSQSNKKRVLTPDEEKRKTDLEEAIQRANEIAPEGVPPLTVTIGEDVIGFDEAQKELDELNISAPVAEATVNLTEQEQNRKAELEETLAKRAEDEKNGITSFEVTDGKGGVTTVTYEEAQAELDALNEKAKVAPVTSSLNQQEQNRKTELEQAIQRANEIAPEGVPPLTVTIGNDVIGFDEAQKELDELNTKTATATTEQATQQTGAPTQDKTQNNFVEVNGKVTELTDDFFDNVSNDGEYEFIVDSIDQVPSAMRRMAEKIIGPKQRSKLLGLPVGKKQAGETLGYRFTLKGNQVLASRDQLVSSIGNKRGSTKAQIFQNTARSLASIFPNLKITNFKNAADMKAYAQKFGAAFANQFIGGEGGVIIYDTNGNPSEILTNDQIADATTLPHEAWHAILIKAFGENEQLFKEFRDSIKQTLIKNGYKNIVTQLEEFSSSPEYIASNTQGEEWMAQLGGLLTASGMTTENITPKANTLLQEIKAIFNKVAEKIIGQPIFLEDATAEDVLDFMVTISERMSKGQDISSFFRDVETIASTTGQNRMSKQIGAKKKLEYAAKLAKERPDLEEQGLTADTISLVEKFGEENSANGMGNPKLEKLAVHWIANGNVKLPEDGYKIVEAEKLAAKNKIDPFAFSNPLDIMEKYQGTIKEKNIDLDTIKEFSNKRSIPGTNVTVYDVEDSQEGQAAVRRVADAHWGKNWNGWCLISRDKDGALDGKAWDLWSNKYNKKPKKIAFENGRIISFQASNSENEMWWDKRDDAYAGVPIREYIKNEKNDKEYIVRSTSEQGDIISTVTFKITPEQEEKINSRGVLVFQKINDKDGNAVIENSWYDNGDVKSKKYFNQPDNGNVFIFFEDNTIADIDTDYAGSESSGENTSLDNHKILDANGNVEVEFSTEIDDESSNPTKTTTVSVFDKDGNVVNKGTRKTNYQDGTSSSEATSVQIIDDNGVVRKETVYNPDSDYYGYFGSTKSKKSWYSNGNKKVEYERFEYGNLAGNQSETREYDRDGNLIREQLEPVEFNFDFQRSSSGGGTLQEVQRIAQRYNVNNQGFAPAQVNEFAMSRELEPYGYSAKRAAPEPNGRQRGVYILNPKGRFHNPFKGKFQRVRLNAAALQESVKSIPGYDRMMGIVMDIIDKSTSRGRTKDEIMNNVMAYVTGPRNAVYTRANDLQREQLVRDVRAMFGKREKSAPSVGKLFDTIKDITMITMSEAELLKQQIRTLARGAKDTKIAWMIASREVAKQIKELVVSGKITNRQAASVISRLAMVNMFNQDSIDKFTEYMTKVFNDANYDQKIQNARKKLPRALANLKKKIGIANAVAPSLVQLFSINPNLIPDKVLERYLELVDMFGSSNSVLQLDDIKIVEADVKTILDAVNEEVSLAEELALRLDAFDNKVYDINDNLEYAQTISKMVEDKVITEDEADIMRKYKKDILPKVEEPTMTEAEIEAEKNSIIKAIRSTAINISSLPTRLERELAERLNDLLKPELLKRLSVNQLNNVMKLVDNINNGYLPRYAQITVEKLNSIRLASTDLVPAIDTAKPLKFSKFVGNLKSKFKKSSTAALEMIRRSPLFFIDQIFGDFNSKRIFNSVFGMMASSHAAFETEMTKVNKKLDAAHEKLSKFYRYKSNKTLASSFRIMTYMVQREYESNPGSDQVNSAARYLQTTINHILNGKSKYKEADAKILEDILDKYGVVVGKDKKGNPIIEIDNKKLYASFNEAEVEAAETIREVNDSVLDKAIYTASIIRGESITPLNNYVHLPVLHEYNSNERETGIENSNNYNNSRRPSSKAQSLVKRSGEVKPINFDAFASAQRGVKYTLLDYHMTEAIRTSRKTINEARTLLQEQGKLKGQNRQILNAIEAANEEVIKNVLTNNFITDSFIDAAINEISKQGYRAILASSTRFVSELTSNIGFVVLSDPKSFAEGLKKETRAIIMSPLAIDIMINVGSKQTKRLFSGDTLSGRFIDTSIMGQASGVKSVTSKNEVMDIANMIYNMSLKKAKNFTEMTSDALISTPDKLVMRPVWFGAFATEFKRETGTDIDFNKIATNDEAYMSKYRDAIKKSTDFADEKSTLTGATDNPFMGILKGSVTADQGNFKRGFNNFNNFMTRFAIYEYAAARQGIYALVGNGSLTRKQGASLLAGVTTRMTLYTMLTKILGSLVLSMFGVEDEEEETEKSFLQQLSQALASTATALIVGRDFGNAFKTVANVGVEKINEEFFTDLRNGEYDPYKDYISYSALPKDKNGQGNDLGDYITMFTGSFTPLLKTVDFGIKKATEDPKKKADAILRQKDEIYWRLPIEILGNIGLIPMYKDIRNVLLGRIYEDLAKQQIKDKKAAKENEIEKAKLGIYESRSDMKRYNPKLYYKTFGPGSPGYNAEQEKKKLAKELSEMKQAMKDTQYGYDPDAIPTKDEMTREELKRYFPEEYKNKYGSSSSTYQEEKKERDMKKEERDARRKTLDAYYGYQGGGKTDKFGAPISNTKTDKFGAPIK